VNVNHCDEADLAKKLHTVSTKFTL